MAKIFDRVKYNVSGTPGMGTVTIGTRSAGGFYLPAERGAADGDEVYYIIVKSNGDEETGIGTVGGSVTTVSRDLVLGSIIAGTAGTTKINLDASAVMAFVTPAEAFRSLRGHREVTGATDTIAVGDGGGAIVYNRATAIATSLAQAGASSQFLKGWCAHVQNIGVGATTITPATSTINGAATLVLAKNVGAYIWSDGTNYHAYILPVTAPALLDADNTFSRKQTVSDTTDATSSAAGGAFTIAGGLAVAKKLFVGLAATIGGVLKVTDTTEATGAGTTASGIFSGGLEVLKKLFVSGIAAFTNATASISTATGAVVVTGGIGVGGAGWFGGLVRSAAGFVSSVSPATAAHLDTSAMSVIPVANGANSAIAPAGAIYGEVLVVDGTNGFAAKYLLNGGSVATIVLSGNWVAPTASPAATKMSVFWNGTAYAVYNNFGSSVNIKATTVKAQ